MCQCKKIYFFYVFTNNVRDYLCRCEIPVLGIAELDGKDEDEVVLDAGTTAIRLEALTSSRGTPKFFKSSSFQSKKARPSISSPEKRNKISRLILSLSIQSFHSMSVRRTEGPYSNCHSKSRNEKLKFLT